MTTEDKLHYRGKPVNELTIEECRAAIKEAYQLAEIIRGLLHKMLNHEEVK